VDDELLVDPDALREQVRGKYREVAVDPGASFHFHTGRPLAARLGYEAGQVDALPDRAVESFAGVANPFSLHPLTADEKVIDVGSGAGFDSFIAAGQVGPGGQVVGVDITALLQGRCRSCGFGRSVQRSDGLALEPPAGCLQSGLLTTCRPVGSLPRRGSKEARAPVGPEIRHAHRGHTLCRREGRSWWL